MLDIEFKRVKDVQALEQKIESKNRCGITSSR